MLLIDKQILDSRISYVHFYVHMHVLAVSICINYNNTRKRYVFSSKTNLRSKLLKRTVLPELQSFTGRLLQKPLLARHCMIVMYKTFS